jgi:hypothetical protein
LLQQLIKLRPAFEGSDPHKAPLWILFSDPALGAFPFSAAVETIPSSFMI